VNLKSDSAVTRTVVSLMSVQLGTGIENLNIQVTGSTKLENSELS
jgi:hypothetical protein